VVEIVGQDPHGYSFGIGLAGSGSSNPVLAIVALWNHDIGGLVELILHGLPSGPAVPPDAPESGESGRL